MQNPNGGTIQLVPQGLTVTPVSYQDGGATLILQSQPSQTTLTTATQIEEAHSTTNHVSSQNMPDQDAAMENDKRAIYRHPLFPLMALLFEKCEQATQTPDCPSSDSFDVDIQAFVHHQEQDRKPFFSEDSELDGLMLKAIQVLRIHLLELEKVNELCKDFCQRYISCLKGKLQSENLLRSDTPGSESDNGGLMSPTLDGLGGNNVLLSGGLGQTAGLSALGQGQVVSGGTVYQMVQTPQGLVAQPIQIQSQGQLSNAQATTTAVIHGSTPLSQIGVASPQPSQTNTVNSNALMLSPDFDDDDKGKGKNSKRGVLPKHATQVMKSWLFQHIVHPYPTEDEKRQIAGQTNLSLLQVNNWFINARRRILQPMLDASNPEGSKAKKNKTPSRPVQRFWPDNIANLQPEVARAMASGAYNAAQNSDTADNQLTEPEDDMSGDEHTGESEGDDLGSQPNTPQPHNILLPPGVSLMPEDGAVYQNSGQMFTPMSQAPSTPASVHNGETLANHAQHAPGHLHLGNSDSSNTED